ncbi:MAG: hypothetical protein FWC61_03460 [Proteobacteria bacterium]|nr:hypothetical protein [Pseudomonadota bacterium]
MGWIKPTYSNPNNRYIPAGGQNTGKAPESNLIEELTNGWKLYQTKSGSKREYVLKANGIPIYKSPTQLNAGPGLRLDEDNKRKFGAANKRWWAKVTFENLDEMCIETRFPNYNECLTITQEYGDDSLALVFSDDGKLLFDENVFRDAFDIDNVISLLPLAHIDGLWVMTYDQQETTAKWHREVPACKDKFKHVCALLTQTGQKPFLPVTVGCAAIRCERKMYAPYIFNAGDPIDISTNKGYSDHNEISADDILKLYEKEMPEIQNEFRKMMNKYRSEHCIG